jgi:outer membrane protein TolC
LTLFSPRPLLLFLAILPGPLLCADPLPEPLTLEAALSSANNPAHFDLLDIDQRLQALRAEMGIASGYQDFQIDLTGRIREVGLSDAALGEDDGGDSAASLILSKPLYDFGLQESREGRIALQLEALELQKHLLIEQRRLDILEKYLAVLDADNQFLSENEALAIGYIRYDNAREDQELGATAEIEVLRLQSEYETIRRKRNLAAQQQRLRRSILAEAMGYPGQLASNLEVPEINSTRVLPEDYEALVTQAMQNSLESLVALANTRAAHAAIQIAEAANGPTLDLELEVSTYERETRTRDDWRAGLYIEIPLYRGSSAATVNRATAHYQRSLAQQQQLQSHLRVEVLKLWQQLQQLQLEIEGRAIEQDYRDRYLDRSRAEYELEFKTDLGDSMVLYSRSNRDRLQAMYAYELAYQRLVTLVGEEYLQALTPPQ